MEPNEIPQILEAILFVAGEPVAVADLAQALEVSEMEIMHAVEELQRECVAILPEPTEDTLNRITAKCATPCP